MNIKVLVEDTKCDGFDCEHGLSMMVEYNNGNYLIDTGKTGLYMKNAYKLGVDFTDTDMVFLSHVHYDHSGGFKEFFDINKNAKVYLQNNAKGKYCYKVAGDTKKYIGIPKGILEEYSDRFVYVDGYYDFGNGIYILPHTTENLAMRGKRAHLYYESDGSIVPDDFSHEQTVVFEENDGLVLFNSCSHAGVENIINEVKMKMPDKRIKAFLGGFHMVGAGGMDTCNFEKDEVQKVARQLVSSGETIFYSGHCTGEIAYKWLKEVMGERLIAFHSGMEIEI